MEGNKRIDQCPGGIMKRGYFGIMRNQDNSETEKFTTDTIVKSTIGNYEWLSSVAFDPGYALDAIVTREHVIYKSLANANSAIPGNDPSKWQVQIRGNSGGKYNAGVYLENDVWVLFEIKAEFHIVQLISAVRPYLSVDLMDEYLVGDWVSITQNPCQITADIQSGAVNLDMELMKERSFNTGGADIDNPKTWAILNDDFALLIPAAHFLIGPTLSSQTFPNNWTVANSDNAIWNSSTKTWTPLAEGAYVAQAERDFGTGEWRVKIQGPYN